MSRLLAELLHHAQILAALVSEFFPQFVVGDPLIRTAREDGRDPGSRFGRDALSGEVLHRVVWECGRLSLIRTGFRERFIRIVRFI